MGIIEDILGGKVKEVDLLEFVTSNDIRVAVAVASSQYATETILDIAAHDKDKDVRLAVVDNKYTGKDTLKFLSNDNEAEIAVKAKYRLERK